ncbi:MAG: hypothetical protein IJO81_00580 [Clostridia bacterium]|nr:hypothetical protein [Clostridia bacterium]
MKKVKTKSAEEFEKLKKAEYILAFAALLFCIVLPIVLSLFDAKITSMWISDAFLMTGIAMAYASAVIATYIRYRKSVSYAVGALCAFIIFSFVYQIVPHTVTFILTLAELCVSVFVLTFGAYNSRREKGVMITYICTALICGVWFLATCV